MFCRGPIGATVDKQLRIVLNEAAVTILVVHFGVFGARCNGCSMKHHSCSITRRHFGSRPGLVLAQGPRPTQGAGSKAQVSCPELGTESRRFGAVRERLTGAGIVPQAFLPSSPYIQLSNQSIAALDTINQDSVVSFRGKEADGTLRSLAVYDGLVLASRSANAVPRARDF